MSEELDLPTEEEVDTSQEKTMDDTIRETLEQIQSRDGEEETDSRSRDEKGRFAKKEETEPVSEEAQVVEEVAQPEPEPVIEVTPELQKLGLRKEDAERLAKLTPEAKQITTDIIARRMEESRRGTELYRQKAEVGDSFEKALAPFMPTIQQTGLHPAEAVQRVMAAEHGLRYGNEDSRAVHALNVLKEYKIDLNRMIAIASGQHQPQMQPPQPPQPQQDVNALIEEAIEKRFLEQEIQKVAATKDHFEELRPLMIALFDSGAASSLEEAYDQALRAHPVYGTEWVSKQIQSAEEKRRQEAAAKVESAKRASAVNVSRKGTLTPAKAVGTMDDTIREKAQELGLIP